MQERAEQLKSIGNMAALVAGFAVVAFLEFSPPKPWEEFSDALTMAFGFTTALVVRCAAYGRYSTYCRCSFVVVRPQPGAQDVLGLEPSAQLPCVCRWA